MISYRSTTTHIRRIFSDENPGICFMTAKATISSIQQTHRLTAGFPMLPNVLFPTKIANTVIPS